MHVNRGSKCWALLKSPSSQKCVFPLVSTLECSSLTVWIDVCVVWHHKVVFTFWHIKTQCWFSSVLIESLFLRGWAQFVTSQIIQIWSSVQHAMYKLEASSAHTHTVKMDFIVKRGHVVSSSYTCIFCSFQLGFTVMITFCFLLRTSQKTH